ncbi:Ku protein [Kaistia geumhonensis]|uniref:Non-homologous end joining protein Ku n=1 Tax=Kaistia geumhonensis TaxID=410839 RepID=A0ABU0M801_9HYPH|nr:Ku protein [Kaistia geumhonensis]MCX5477688.1 Ku protein [Kaistia geumhonensis]MDQ0517103.1 DNA end-binding protein Ku [Kaistia geumhonensis]
MAPRANWKGHLKIGELAAAVALYSAATTSDRVSFNMINRRTGHRIERHFVDSETGEPVDRDDQVKGYDTGGDPIVFEPEEIAAAMPESDKTIAVDAFIPCAEIDDIYLDRSYYLAPADRHAEEAFALLREGMRAEKVAALARAVLFRRARLLLIRPEGDGMIATTLHFAYEMRSAAEAFEGIAEPAIEGEMLELAEHIIRSKAGRFDPAAFDDRYDAALAELVKAKIEGRELPKPKPVERTKSSDLLAALRESAGVGGKPGRGSAKGRTAAKGAPQRKSRSAATRRKAG